MLLCFTVFLTVFLSGCCAYDVHNPHMNELTFPGLVSGVERRARMAYGTQLLWALSCCYGKRLFPLIMATLRSHTSSAFWYLTWLWRGSAHNPGLAGLFTDSRDLGSAFQGGIVCNLFHCVAWMCSLIRRCLSSLFSVWTLFNLSSFPFLRRVASQCFWPQLPLWALTWNFGVLVFS